MAKPNFSSFKHKNDLKILFAKYLKHKFWFLLSLVVFMTASYLYITYTVPKYQAGASVQIIEEKSASSQLRFFSDLDILPGANKNVEDEIEVIRSRPNLIEAVRNLSLNKKIFHLGKFRDTEIYKNNPINFTFLSKDSLVNDSKFSCFIVPLSGTKFSFWTEDDKQREFTFGDEIETGTGKITILPEESSVLNAYVGKRLKIELLPFNEAAMHYAGALKMGIKDRYSSVIDLSIQDPVQEKAIDFLNELVNVYNVNGQNDKKVIADRTAEFIDDRIAGIYNDLSAADQSAQDFKSGRGLTDIRSQSDINLNISAASQKELQNAQIKLQLAEGMKDILDSQEDYSKIVNPAFASSVFPVSPKKRIIFLVSLMLSLLIPMGVIYGFELFDDKIHNAHLLKKLVADIPVIGELPRLKDKNFTVVQKDDRSELGEALRMIRTNIDFLLQTKSNKKSKRNTIFITSNLPKEGKTFLTTNLAMVFANSYKKILLIGADIRNPKFHLFLEPGENETPKTSKNTKGLTDFLFDESLTLSDIAEEQTINGNTIDVIFSGKIYPNPSELLMSARIELLLEQVTEKYDYVLVDTAPMMPVTDTLLISKYADLLLYVTRAGQTNISDIEYPLMFKKEGKLPNLAFVVNAVKSSELGYGGKYGYGYGLQKPKWWKFRT